MIEQKMSRAKEQLDSLQEQILEITENSDDEYGSDWMDDSSINDNIEMLNDMAIRQRKYLRDLENALVRIRNKTYGICVVTGELIDPKRLRAVPTTTKSLKAKQEADQPPVRQEAPPADDVEDEDEIKEKKTPRVSQERRVITRVIRKSSSTPKPPVPLDDDDDEDLDLPDLDLEEDSDTEDISIDSGDIDLNDFADDSGQYDDEEL